MAPRQPRRITDYSFSSCSSSSSSSSNSSDSEEEDNDANNGNRNQTVLTSNNNFVTEEELWNIQFQELVAFHQQYGHCNVPVHSRTSTGTVVLSKQPNNENNNCLNGQSSRPSLAQWVARQRQHRRHGDDTQLSVERIRKLDQLGFRWRDNKTQTASRLIPPVVTPTPTSAVHEVFETGTRVYKFFAGHGWSLGEIVSVTPKDTVAPQHDEARNTNKACHCCYTIQYEDGDQEEYDTSYEERAFQRIVQQYKTVYLGRKGSESDNNEVLLTETKKTKRALEGASEAGSKKQKTQQHNNDIENSDDSPRHVVGTRVRKYFEGHGWFDGTIAEHLVDRYLIVYDDEDEEEYLFWGKDGKAVDQMVDCAASHLSD